MIKTYKKLMPYAVGVGADAGQKILDSRKKKLAEFKEKILSPQPQKKKIKPLT